MKKLYFIRHGESVGNLQELFTGQWDVPLTDLGRRQAKTAAKSIESVGVDCIVSSPLLRARQTAEIIAAQINYPAERIKYSDLFMERNYGDLQQKPYSEAEGVDFETVPNIEPLALLLERAKQAAEYVNQIKADNVLVVGHGTQGRAFRLEIQHRGPEAIEVPIEQEIPNAEVIRWI